MNTSDANKLEAGLEIDFLMAKYFMKWESITNGLNYLPSMGTVYSREDAGIWKFTRDVAYLWSPSTNILDTWELTEKLDVFRLTKTFGLSGTKWVAKMNDAEVYEKSASMAICRVIFLTREEFK